VVGSPVFTVVVQTVTFCLLMYGEGYDWTPLYSVRSGQMVGALPVGIETKGYNDAPYWPTQICWTYKEVWTAPVGQCIWLMQDISVPATIRGTSDPANHAAIEFREERSVQSIQVAAALEGEFNVRLPEGQYNVHHGTAHTTVTVLPGGIYSLDLRPERFLDFTVTFQPAPNSGIVVRLEASGAGALTETTSRFTASSSNITRSFRCCGTETVDEPTSINPRFRMTPQIRRAIPVRRDYE